MSAARDEYRHVVLHGRYLAGRQTRVQALTELGAGDWVLEPLLTADGPVLVNRGFVPDGARSTPPPAGHVKVTGLLRVPERLARLKENARRLGRPRAAFDLVERALQFA